LSAVKKGVCSAKTLLAKGKAGTCSNPIREVEIREAELVNNCGEEPEDDHRPSPISSENKDYGSIDHRA